MAERTVLGGRYELGDPLGRGGMAEVRRGVDLRLNRPVAVKILRKDLASDSVFRTRFRREAQSAAGLNNPSIVAVFDTGEESDPVTGISVPFIVMELVEGQTLRAVLTGGHQLPPKRALEVTQGVLDALGHSHDAGIVHRDIKPANVMLTPAGEVKVMDFGIARAVADTSSDLTQTAAVIGTAQYLSPEQARGETVDLRSDIYSTGCLMYELLVGRPPFVGETAISLAYQHVREAPVPPSQHNPLIHPQIEAITLKALAKDPGDRYQSAREMKGDIARVLAGQAVAPPVTDEAGTVVAEPVPEPTVVAAAAVTSTAPDHRPAQIEPEDPPPAKRRGVVLLVGALVLLLMAAGGYAIYRAAGPDQPVVAAVNVPDLLGATRAEAESRLRGAGLEPRFMEVSGKDDETVDTVVNQRPVSGSEVAAASVVTAEINVGTETAVIPTGLLGKDVDKAEKELEEAGFSNVRTERADDQPTGADQDDVVSIDPAEGTSLALDKRITLFFAVDREKARPTQQRETSAPKPTKSKSDESPETAKSTDAPESDEPSATSPTAPETSETSAPTSPEASEPTASSTPTATNTSKEPEQEEQGQGDGDGDDVSP
jgi:serine/threonine-protein kinase